MKVCENCGYLNDSHAPVCANCGRAFDTTTTPIVADAVQPQQQSPQPGYGYGAPVAGNGATVTGIGARAILQRAAASKLFLAAVVSFTAVLALTVISSVLNGIHTFSVWQELAAAVGPEDAEAFTVLPTYGVSLPVLQIVTMIGLWIIYKDARKEEPWTRATGLTVVKVVLIIELVFICIAAALLGLLALLIPAVFQTLSNEPFYDPAALSALSAVLGVIGVIIIAVFAFCIVYYARAIKTVNTAREMLYTDIPARSGVSAFVGVCMFLSAGSTVIGLFSLVGLNGLMSQIAQILEEEPAAFELFTPTTGAVMALMLLASALSSVLFGILIFRVREELDRAAVAASAYTGAYMNGYPPYGYTPAAPVPSAAPTAIPMPPASPEAPAAPETAPAEAPAPAPAFCTGCGAPLSPGVAFCKNCGTPVKR